MYRKIILAARIGGSLLMLLGGGVLILRRRLQRLTVWLANELVRTLAYFRPWFSSKEDGLLHNAALLLILILSFWLRLYFLAEPLRKDEAYSYLYYAKRPLVLGISYYTANNHLLNTLLMHVSTAVFGEKVWALRLPTFLAGCLVPFLTYFVVSLWHSRRAALLSLSLASVSSPLIEYSFNARGYSLGAVFFLLAVALIKPASKRRMGAWLFISLFSALALYSVPTMLYGVVAVYAYLLWRCGRRYVRYVLGSAGLAIAITAVLLGPVLLTVGPRAITSNKWVVPLSRAEWPGTFMHELVSLAKYWTTDVPWLVIPVFAVAIAWVFTRRRTIIFPPVALIMLLAIVIGVALPLQSVVPPRRSYLYALPLFCMAVGVGLSYLLQFPTLRKRSAVWLALLFACGLGGRVFAFKSLEHSGLESAGCRGADQIVPAFRKELNGGAQFICGEGYDSPLDFFIQTDGVRYHPSPQGGLLVVTAKQKSPEVLMGELGLTGKVLGFKHLMDFDDVSVYRAERGPNLMFEPGGDATIGAFTSYSR